ncbi:MAG: hypothetical protein ACXWQO_16985, partial [Bdellovibrionota bacterium]
EGDTDGKKYRTCDANFYAGMKEIRDGNQSAAKPFFQNVLKNCSKTELNWQAANLELKKLASNHKPKKSFKTFSEPRDL